MNKKRIIYFLLLFSFIAIGFINIVMIASLLGNEFITGYYSQTSTGGVYVRIVKPINITIHSPINNWTYSFNVADGIEFENNLYYPIELRVSADEPVSNWQYSIYNNNNLIEEKIPFSPNSTLFFRQGINKIIIYATNDPGVWFEAVSEFEITVGESVPILITEDEFFLCEGSFFRRDISAIDYDQNIVEFGIQPDSPIFVETYSSRQDGIFYYGSIYTSYIQKMMVNTTLPRLLYVYDEDEFHASKSVYFHVLEVNRIPEYDRLGVYKLWTKGKDHLFNKTWFVYDIEDGFLTDGFIETSISYMNGSSFDLFELSPNGSMFYEITNDSVKGVYNLTLCAKDRPLLNLHPDLEVHCGVNGSSNIVCENLYLTISDENRPVKILEANPIKNPEIIPWNATNITNFWILAEDFDGDILEYNFSHGDKEIYYNITNSYDLDYRYLINFSYDFGCGIYGLQNITFNISDGLNFDSVSWTFNVNGYACAEEVVSPPGGGGNVPLWCLEKWGCNSWSVCQDVESSFKLGIINTDEYYNYKDKCIQLGYKDGRCGFQTRVCDDLNGCNNSEYRIPKPFLTQVCYFSMNPNCFDGIKNCHDESCETGIDCGGPCNACPTCSDKIQNQGEEGIDCGGPCPFVCEKETPLFISLFIISLLLLLLILIIFIINRIIKLIKGKNLTREDKRSLRIKRLMQQKI